MTGKHPIGKRKPVIAGTRPGVPVLTLTVAMVMIVFSYEPPVMFFSKRIPWTNALTVKKTVPVYLNNWSTN